MISIHIPQGEKLTLDQVKESLILGMDFWGKELPYLCHSWLLYPGLKDILPESSNILQFQNEFQIIETDLMNGKLNGVFLENWKKIPKDILKIHLSRKQRNSICRKGSCWEMVWDY